MGTPLTTGVPDNIDKKLVSVALIATRRIWHWATTLKYQTCSMKSDVELFNSVLFLKRCRFRLVVHSTWCSLFLSFCSFQLVLNFTPMCLVSRLHYDCHTQWTSSLHSYLNPPRTTPLCLSHFSFSLANFLSQKLWAKNDFSCFETFLSKWLNFCSFASKPVPARTLVHLYLCPDWHLRHQFVSVIFTKKT